MSKLEELIAELCPDGVKYLEIPELFDTRNGYTPSKSNKEYWENGEVPWFRMEDIRENGRVLSKATQYVSKSAVKGKPFPENSIIIATSATIGEHALITVPSLANQRFTYLMLKDKYKDLLDIKFIYYCCFKLDVYCKACLNQGNFASVDIKKFVKFRFPVPPLEVQSEIVRILDNFTELTTELTAELTAELTSRKKQYEYYRNKLLNVADAPMKILKVITHAIASGKNKERLDDGIFPVYGSTGIISSTNTAVYHKKQILIARVGANAGYVHIAAGDYDVSDNALIVDLQSDVSLKYIYYQLSSMNLHQYAKGGGQPLVTAGQMKELTIPVPPIEKQEEIVQVLDRFYMLCNDISSGLPAEIEARTKQYEYYRDKLLTFDDVGATA